MANVPVINVVKVNGQLITLDNRRLAAFSAAGIDKIPINIKSLSDSAVRNEFLKKNNPIGDGTFTAVVKNRKDGVKVRAELRRSGTIK